MVFMSMMLNSKTVDSLFAKVIGKKTIATAYSDSSSVSLKPLKMDESASAESEEPMVAITYANKPEALTHQSKAEKTLLNSNELLKESAKNFAAKEKADRKSNSRDSQNHAKSSEPLKTENTGQNANSTAAPSSASLAVKYITGVSKHPWEYVPSLDKYVVRYDKNTYGILTIKPKLQKMLEGVLEKYDTRFGVAIIQDPASGAILAMATSHKNQITDILSEEYKTSNWALKATFPAASLFKIITAAAAIDTGKGTPNTPYLAYGKTYMKMWKAFANSHNGVFGRIAKSVGIDVVMKYARDFGFNKSFFFDLPVSNSIAKMPEEEAKQMQACAGLNKNFLLSPIHAVSLTSTVINLGKTMKPYLLDSVISSGKTVYRRQPFQLAQPIKAKTAKELYKMMYSTTAIGTGKKGFSGYRKTPELAKISGGKTGTLTGESPHYLFTWFAGFTKATGRDLTILTLSGQQDHSGTKAASIAGQVAYELRLKRWNDYSTQDIIAKK